MLGARCALAMGGATVQKGRGAVRPASVIRCKHAHRSSKKEFLEHLASPMPLSQKRHHKHTRHHISHSRGAGRGAVRLLGGGGTVPECTVCQTATTGGVPANCAVQPTMPYALTTRFHINPTVSETDELPATFANTFAAGRVPDQAS